MQSSLSLFMSRSIAAQQSLFLGQEYYLAVLNPQMASPHFPFSHIPGEIPLSLSMGTTDVRWCLKDLHPDTVDPQVASCIRFDHRQAIHVLQHRSSKVTQGQLKALKAMRGNKASSHTKAGPIRVGLPTW